VPALDPGTHEGRPYASWFGGYVHRGGGKPSPYAEGGPAQPAGCLWTNPRLTSDKFHFAVYLMPMKNPVHPGRIVRHDCLEPLGLSVTEGAKVLGVTRQALNNVVNGKSGISPEMAIRLAKAFGSTAETWLRMQLAFDLAAARKEESKIKVRRQHLEELHAN
jgi:addiction module HigA family antidote